MGQIFIQLPAEGVRSDLIRFAKSQGYGVEVTAFALPWVLDGDLRSMVRRYKEALEGFTEEIVVHGVFMDMITASRDERIVRVCGERLRQNLGVASELGAAILTVCSCYNPSIAASAPSYLEGYVARQVAFWRSIAHQAAELGMVLAFENLWEPSPHPVVSVVEGVGSAHFRALLDTGHANLFSKVPLADWVDAWVASIGTGGTILGVAEALREKIGGVKVVGLEPEDARVTEWYTSGSMQKYLTAVGLPRMKSLVEVMLEKDLPDEVWTVRDDDAREMMNRLCREEGLFCGMSSGANVYAALKVAKKLGKGANVVTVSVDRRERYFPEFPREHYVI